MLSTITQTNTEHTGSHFVDKDHTVENLKVEFILLLIELV